MMMKPAPKTPAQKMLDRGSSITYFDEDLGGIVEERPDGTILLIDRIGPEGPIYKGDPLPGRGQRANKL